MTVEYKLFQDTRSEFTTFGKSHARASVHTSAKEVNLFAKDWFLSSVLTFITYEILWNILVLHTYNKPDWGTYSFDMIYCGIFVAISLSLGKLFYKFRYFKSFTLLRQIVLHTIILTSNIVLAYLFEFCYDKLIPADTEELYHDGIYLFCFIATMSTAAHNISYYFTIISKQQNQLSALNRQVLKNKLDPHFVFNSLSVLTELIYQEPKQAEEYCIRFARFYRHILMCIDNDYISVHESLKFVQEYVTLQQYRTEGRIELNISSFTTTTNEYLFPLALQTLVENSIKHNMPHIDEVLRITIARDENYLTVTNNVIEGTLPTHSFGIGLQTLCMQYKMENLPEPNIKHNKELFEVQILILKKR